MRALALSLVMACGGAAAPTASPTATASAATAASERVAPVSDVPVPAVPADAARLLASARRHAAALDWRACERELEQAARIAPRNPIVLGELTWAALQAGDASRADVVGRVAVGLGGPASLRAQLLYNAGRAAQALGDVARARADYDASLRLRPNDEVSAQRDSLTASAELEGVTLDPSEPCQRGRTVAAVARCLDATLTNSSPTSPKRSYRAHQASADFVVFEVGPEDMGDSMFTGGFGAIVVYRKTPAGLARVGLAGSPGASAKYAWTTTFSLAPSSERTVSSRRVVLLAWTTTTSGYCGGCGGGVTSKIETVTLCLPATGTCPVQATVASEYDLAAVQPEDAQHDAETFDLRVADDGTVTTTLRQGTAATAHASSGRGKLW